MCFSLNCNFTRMDPVIQEWHKYKKRRTTNSFKMLRASQNHIVEINKAFGRASSPLVNSACAYVSSLKLEHTASGLAAYHVAVMSSVIHSPAHLSCMWLFYCIKATSLGNDTLHRSNQERLRLWGWIRKVSRLHTGRRFRLHRSSCFKLYTHYAHTHCLPVALL